MFLPFLDVNEKFDGDVFLNSFEYAALFVSAHGLTENINSDIYINDRAILPQAISVFKSKGFCFFLASVFDP